MTTETMNRDRIISLSILRDNLKRSLVHIPTAEPDSLGDSLFRMSMKIKSDISPELEQEARGLLEQYNLWRKNN